VTGTLGLWRRGTRPPHSERDQNFVQELADRAALAIENARLVRSLREEVEDRKGKEDSLRLTAELLQRADDKRRALMEHLVTAQEEERRRIAIDVHDDSIQSMAAIGIRLQILRRHAPGNEMAKQLEELMASENEVQGFSIDTSSELKAVGQVSGPMSGAVGSLPRSTIMCPSLWLTNS